MDTNEYLMQLQILEQQAGHFEEQLEVIDQQVEELKRLKKNLEDFQETKDTEVYSEFGKGIYFKSNINKNELLVDLIIQNREGKIKIIPGFDGRYGKAILSEKQDKLF